MLRKNRRLRKEDLYSKAQEHENKTKAEKKPKIKEALETGTRIPNELRIEEENLR